MEENQKKKDLDNEFYYSEGKIHLYDADSFLSQIKHLMIDIVEDVEFGVYFGISEDDCLDVWLRDENGVMYQVEPKQLENDESELRIKEVSDEEENDE